MSSTVPRNFPYVWVTWLTGLLAGEKHCKFALWYRAHYQYEKRPRTGFDSTAWAADHDRCVGDRRDELRALGKLVTIEDQNSFKVKGRTVLLSGKIDLVSRMAMGSVADVGDVKTGKKRKEDWWQVLIYIWALKRLRTDPKSKQWHTLPGTINGEIIYPPSKKYQRPEREIERVLMDEVTPDRETMILNMLRLAGGTERPGTTPSYRECLYCDVADCRDRIVEQPQGESSEQEDF